MKKDRLEEKLRGSLSEYPSPMDLEGAWSQLERTRNQKKRRGLLFWWLGIAGGSIGVLLIALLLPNSTLSDTSIATSNTQYIDHQEESIDDSSGKKITEVEATVITSLPQSTPSVGSTNSVSLSPSFLEKTGQPLTTVPAKNQIAGEDLTEKSLDEPLFDASLAPASVVSEMTSRGTMGKKVIELATSAIAPSRLQEIPVLEALPLQATRYRRNRNKGGDWWIGFGATIGLQQRNLSINPSANQEVKELLARRNASEKPMEAYSFSFDIRRDVGSNWYLQSGVRHQLGYEHFEDQYERTFDKVLEDQLTQIIQRADGTTTEIRGDVTIEVTESVNSSIYNTQNLTEIPLLVGYQQELTSKVSLDVSLGFLYALIQRKEGQVHESATSVGAYQALGQMPYRQSNLFGGQLQGTVTYRLGDPWEWYGGVQAKIYPNLVDANADFSERQLLLNAVLGIRYRLGN